jgi:hypothetical protein
MLRVTVVTAGDSLGFSLGSWCGLGLRHLAHFIFISGQLHTYNMRFSTLSCGWQSYGCNPRTVTEVAVDYSLGVSHSYAVGFDKVILTSIHIRF